MGDTSIIDGPTDRHDDLEHRKSLEELQRRKSRWSAAIETFSPIWFAVVMNTGVLSTIMRQLPYQFSALGILSTIMFILAIVLFVVFTLVHITRLICFPRSAYQQTVSDHEQTCLWGCASIGLLTITTQISLTASTAKWGYHDLSVVAYVIWWIATACMVTTAMVVYIFLIKTKHTKDVTLTAAILIPAVGTMTDALVGGIICTYSSDLSARMAVPVIVVSYMLLGFALFTALCVYALFLYSLLTNGMYLQGAKYPGLLLLVGPMGQASGAIQELGNAASKNFGQYNQGTFLTQQATSPIASISVVLALMFVGFDLFWLMFALYFIVDGAAQRKLSFTMTWWSTIFPVATLNIALLNLSIEMDSPAFRVLTTGMLLILLIDYFICWGFTFWGIWEGRILNGREELAELAKKSN